MKKINLLLLSLIVSSPLLGLPEGMRAISGEAVFDSSNAKLLNITVSDKAILHYDSFNIAEQQTVKFVQPTAKSVVLNRVLGNSPSQILGALQANGRVYLVNERGIYFGQNSTINTASFVASTLAIADEDFFSGQHRFTLCNRESAIINEGSLNADPEGFIALIAPRIENQGVITAQAGQVLLASSEKVLLDFSGDKLLRFAVSGTLDGSSIENSGHVLANHGQVTFTANGANQAIHTVINTDGITPANHLDTSGGVIRLLSNSRIQGDSVTLEGSQLDISGCIDAANPLSEAIGGTIHLLGETVALKECTLNASGSNSGGTILIGGDYQGQGNVRNANRTTVDSDSTIYADAYNSGDGGKVIVWADHSAVFEGKVFARGGRYGGNGGLVETSGKLHLAISSGSVNTSAPLGQFGTWLLDPSSVTIQSGGPANIGDVTTNCANAGVFTIDPGIIELQPSSVVICAQNGSGSILVYDSISMFNAGAGLTLLASGEIIIAGPVSITTKGAAITLNAPTVKLQSNTVTLDTTNTAATGADIQITGDVTTLAPLTRPIALTLNAGTNGTVTMAGVIASPVTSEKIDNLTITNANTVSMLDPIAIDGALEITASGTITVGGGIDTGGAVQFTNSGGPTSIGGSITCSSALTFHSALLLTASPITLTASSATFASTVNGSVSGRSLIVTTTGTVDFNAAVGDINSMGSVTINNGGILTALAAFTGSGPFRQGGAEAAKIGGNITGSSIRFDGALQLTGNATFTNTNTSGNFVFVTIDSFDTTLRTLTLTNIGNRGTLTVSGAIGATHPLNGLTINNFVSTTTAAVTLSSGGLANTSAIINLNGNIDILGGGTCTLTNSGVLTMASGTTLDLTGAFLQNGTGLVSIGATINSNGNAIRFQRALTLIGPTTLDSASGAIQFDSNVSGNYALSVDSGTATTTLGGSSYSTASQTYLGSGQTSLTGAATLATTGGSIEHQSSTLSIAGDLTVSTSGGDFLVNTLQSTGTHNVAITAGTGRVGIGTIPSGSPLGLLTVNAGEVLFSQELNFSSADFTSLSGILNVSTPTALNSSGAVSLNALGGNVGSQDSPIEVQSGGQISAGATNLATITGSSVDDTVQVILSNPPCLLLFNGLTVFSRSCRNTADGSSVPRLAFAGFDSSYWNLASMAYFLPGFITSETLILRNSPLFVERLLTPGWDQVVRLRRVIRLAS